MSDDEHQERDHAEGLLLLRRIAGRLRVFRIRNLKDAFDRGGPFV
jgi:hypothetical protein